MTRLMKYRWPGNVRELQNVVERALIRSSGRTLVLDEWPNTSAMSDSDTTPVASLENVERSHIVAILERCSWRINGAGNAAVQLGLHPNTLRFRMKKLAITRPASRSVA
jgi:transcriptional regulator of acetoin/glycerol metabolism